MSIASTGPCRANTRRWSQLNSGRSAHDPSARSANTISATVTASPRLCSPARASTDEGKRMGTDCSQPSRNLKHPMFWWSWPALVPFVMLTSSFESEDRCDLAPASRTSASTTRTQ